MSKARGRLTITFGKGGIQKATATGSEARKLFEALTGYSIEEAKTVDFVPALPPAPPTDEAPVIKPSGEIKP